MSNNTLALELHKNSTAIKSVIGEDPKKFMRLALNVLEGNDKLKAVAERNPRSFIGAVMAAAKDGFEPGDQFCWLIPYGSDVQYQKSYIGEMEMASRTGKYKSIIHGIIKQGDLNEERFIAEKGFEVKFIHRPDWFGDRGETVGYYCATELLTGERDFTIMTKAEVEQVRQHWSMAKNSPSWAKSFDQMALKTVIKRHLKTKPKTNERPSTEGIVKGFAETENGVEIEIKPDEEEKSLKDQLPDMVKDEPATTVETVPPQADVEVDPVDKDIADLADRVRLLINENLKGQTKAAYAKQFVDNKGNAEALVRIECCVLAEGLKNQEAKAIFIGKANNEPIADLDFVVTELKEMLQRQGEA